ncbi:hypothetical protein ACHAXR_006684 [Thalassiosira sp. AJA248-18]
MREYRAWHKARLPIPKHFLRPHQLVRQLFVVENSKRHVRYEVGADKREDAICGVDPGSKIAETWEGLAVGGRRCHQASGWPLQSRPPGGIAGMAGVAGWVHPVLLDMAQGVPIGHQGWRATYAHGGLWTIHTAPAEGAGP